VLALPGQVGAMAFAPTAGVVAAGDDRGEAGLWARDGARRGAWRFRAAVTGADVDPDGARAAFVAADGDARVVRPGGGPDVAFRVAPGDRVVLDRAGPGCFSLTPATGRVDARDAGGRATGSFSVPAPVVGVASIARTGGLATVTREGVVARVSGWGALAWGGDWKRYASGVATDGRGEIVVACFLSHGAEMLHASSGARVGLIDLGRPVECAAASLTHVAVGATDGTIALLDRSRRVVAVTKCPGRVLALGVSDGGVVFARLEDGTVRTFQVEGTVVAPAAPPPGAVAYCRELARTRASSPPRIVAVAPAGEHVVVAEDGRRVALHGPGGAVLAEERHEGDVLALRVGDDGQAYVATTLEVRRVGAGGPLQVRRFAVEQVRAEWSPDGTILLTADEVGAVRIVDTATGRERRGGVQMEIGDTVERLFVTNAGAALETRRGRVLAVGPKVDRDVPAVRGTSRARLVGATPDGPVLALAAAVIGCGWDGAERWTHKLQRAASSVAGLGDGRVAVVLRDALVVLGRDGRVEGEHRRPEGDLTAVSCGKPPVLVWRDGRRLTVSDVDGVVRAEATLDAKVLAAAVADGGGAAAALLDGALCVLRVALRPPDRAGPPAVGVASGA
jgi:hypothetical protein